MSSIAHDPQLIVRHWLSEKQKQDRGAQSRTAEFFHISPAYVSKVLAEYRAEQEQPKPSVRALEVPAYQPPPDAYPEPIPNPERIAIKSDDDLLCQLFVHEDTKRSQLVHNVFEASQSPVNETLLTREDCERSPIERRYVYNRNVHRCSQKRTPLGFPMCRVCFGPHIGASSLVAVMVLGVVGMLVYGTFLLAIEYPAYIPLAALLFTGSMAWAVETSNLVTMAVEQMWHNWRYNAKHKRQYERMA